MFVKVILRLHKVTPLYALTKNFTVQPLIKEKMMSPKMSPKMQVFEKMKEKFSDVFVQPNSTSKERWEDMRRYMIESDTKPTVTDTLVLHLFNLAQHPDVGICYYKFLEDNNYMLSTSAIIKYLQLYTLDNVLITEANKNHILYLYQNLKSRYELFNAEMASILVHVLCKMAKWTEAIEIMSKFEANDTMILRKAHSDLIKYLFLFGEKDLGNKHLIDAIQKRTFLRTESYSAYLKYCLKNKNTFNENIENLFLLWSKYGLRPSEEVVLEFISACNIRGWSAKLTTVTRSVCQACGQKISGTSLSDENYNSLCNYMKKTIINEEIYNISNTHQIMAFMKFVDKNKPYDIIIDGLNFYYICCNKEVQKRLNPLIKPNEKALIITRNHTWRLYKKIRSENVHCYFLNDLVGDDLFSLYAAFSSGRNVKFVSRDIMRQHKHMARDPEINTIFLKWQVAHQFTETNRQLHVNESLDAVTLKTDGHWHVPYVKDLCMSSLGHMCNWACFKINS